MGKGAKQITEGKPTEGVLAQHMDIFVSLCKWVETCSHMQTNSPPTIQFFINGSFWNPDTPFTNNPPPQIITFLLYLPPPHSLDPATPVSLKPDTPKSLLSPPPSSPTCRPLRSPLLSSHDQQTEPVIRVTAILLPTPDITVRRSSCLDGQNANRSFVAQPPRSDEAASPKKAPVQANVKTAAGILHINSCRILFYCFTNSAIASSKIHAKGIIFFISSSRWCDVSKIFFIIPITLRFV